jgi:hypothetical protein
MIEDVEDLDEVWYILDMCFDRSEKYEYIAKALEPIVKLRNTGHLNMLIPVNCTHCYGMVYVTRCVPVEVVPRSHRNRKEDMLAM